MSRVASTESPAGHREEDHYCQETGRGRRPGLRPGPDLGARPRQRPRHTPLHKRLGLTLLDDVAVSRDVPSRRILPVRLLMSASRQAPLLLAKPLLSLGPASRTGPEDTLWKPLSPVWLLPPHALLSPGRASPSLCLRSAAPGRVSCPKSPHLPRPSAQQDTGCWGVAPACSCCLGILRLRSGPGVAVLPKSSIPNVHPRPTSERGRPRMCPGRLSHVWENGEWGGWANGQSSCPGMSSRMS